MQFFNTFVWWRIEWQIIFVRRSNLTFCLLSTFIYHMSNVTWYEKRLIAVLNCSPKRMIFVAFFFAHLNSAVTFLTCVRVCVCILIICIRGSVWHLTQAVTHMHAHTTHIHTHPHTQTKTLLSAKNADASTRKHFAKFFQRRPKGPSWNPSGSERAWWAISTDYFSFVTHREYIPPFVLTGHTIYTNRSHTNYHILSVMSLSKDFFK